MPSLQYYVTCLQKKVLVEIACGIGASAVYLEGMYERYIGIDYAANAIQIAREFHRDRHNVVFPEENVKHVTQADIGAEADIVLAVGALHHMDDVDSVMRSMKSIARPGGAFVAIEPQNGNPLIQGLRKLRMAVDPTYSKEQHFFSEKELVSMLSPHLKSIGLEYHGFLSTPFAQVILKPQWIFVPMSRLQLLVTGCYQSMDHAPYRGTVGISW